MPQLLRADRSTDHPTREPVDHANLDRRFVKHPKVVNTRAKVEPKRGRPSGRG